MESIVNETPLEAWRYLLEYGGIEIPGRDDETVEALLEGLNPTAPSLEHALATATMEQFCRAFFRAIDPYFTMFRGILDFFEQADATQARSEWKLKVDEEVLELEHFRKSLLRWQKVTKATIFVPSIDERGVWRLWNVLDKRPLIGEQVRSVRTKTPNVPSDVLAWLRAYEQGRYAPLPNSLGPLQCPTELRTVALIAQAMLQPLLERKIVHPPSKPLQFYEGSGGQNLYNPNNPRLNRGDAFNFWTILQSETDHCLRTLVTALAVAALELDDGERRLLGRELDDVTQPYPMRPFDVNVSLSDILTVITLPIWKKRHELYAVWIATEMIRSLGGHEIEIHHDNGCIEFAFRETVVATIHTSRGPFRLISERRCPLANPQGESREAGVQPDYGFWTTLAGKEVCRLVVEVKHYKQSAKQAFLDVFVDYARALPQSHVYLVSHGPTGNAASAVPTDLSARCHALGRLTTSQPEVRQKLAEAVRDCVGKPIPRWPATGGTGKRFALACDVSGSMHSAIKTTEMYEFIRYLSASEKLGVLAAIDQQVIKKFSLDDTGLAAILDVRGGSTCLQGPVEELLREFECVIVITDSSGLETLAGLNTVEHPLQPKAPENIVVRICAKG
jgi:hypothetical protein